MSYLRMYGVWWCFFFQAEDGIRDLVRSRGLGDVYKRQVKYEVKKFMFASTGGAVYGEQDYFPADEKHNQQPKSPYGISKLAVEKYLYFYNSEHKLNYTILRYANIYGPRQNPFGEAGVVAIFSTKLLKGDQPVINGHGKQTRDYVFVGDVVKANLLGLKDEVSDVYNIGTGIETDVNQLFRYINAVSYTHLTLPNERSSVDLGGRRIIKKKKNDHVHRSYAHRT